MALSTIPKTIFDGSLTVEDGASLSITAQFDQGDFSIDPLKVSQNETTVIETRHRFRGIRNGARIYPTGSFTLVVCEFTEASTGTIADAVLKNGAWSSAVSTLGANAEKYTVKLTFTQDGDAHGESDNNIILDDVECTLAFSEGDPNTVTISYTVYGAITGSMAVATP